ncbi:MAG: hypothetical protein ACTHK5_09485 [Tsuneonella sp.]
MIRFASLALLAPIAFLAACNSEPAPAPTPTATAAPTPTEPALPAPDDKIFAEVLAKACPKAEKVSISSCKSAGMGSKDFICQYGLGADKYMRNTLTLAAKDGEWTVKDAEKACAQQK